MKPVVQKFYLADRIFTGEDWLQDHAVMTENGIISGLIPASLLSGDNKIESYPDHFIAPAFIDLQIYGAYGKLLAVYPDPKR
jgi:N-acetylglucosamine-6-phosphate deacetylase